MNFRYRYLTEAEKASAAGTISNPGGVNTFKPVAQKSLDNDAKPAESTSSAKEMALTNTMADDAINSLPPKHTSNDATTKMKASMRLLNEASEAEKTDNKFKRAIGLPPASYFKAITPDRDVEELAKQTRGQAKSPSKRTDPTSLPSIRTITTKTRKQDLNTALTGLGTNQKKQDKKKKNAETDRTPGNLEEARLLLEANTIVSRSSAGNPGTLGGPETGVKGHKPTVGSIVDDIGDGIERRNKSLNASIDDAGGVKIKRTNITPFSYQNSMTNKLSAHNNLRTQNRLEEERKEKEAREAAAQEGRQ